MPDRTYLIDFGNGNLGGQNCIDILLNVASGNDIKFTVYLTIWKQKQQLQFAELQWAEMKSLPDVVRFRQACWKLVR